MTGEPGTALSRAADDVISTRRKRVEALRRTAQNRAKTAGFRARTA